MLFKLTVETVLVWLHGKIREQISSPPQPYEKNIYRTFFPTLCLIIRFHKHAPIYFSILFVFLPRCMESRRGLAMRILSVRPSVKRVDCDKTEERCV